MQFIVNNCYIDTFLIKRICKDLYIQAFFMYNFYLVCLLLNQVVQYETCNTKHCFAVQVTFDVLYLIMIFFVYFTTALTYTKVHYQFLVKVKTSRTGKLLDSLPSEGAVAELCYDEFIVTILVRFGPRPKIVRKIPLAAPVSFINI